MSSAAPSASPLLVVDGLRVSVLGPEGCHEAVRGVSFRLSAGEIVGLVGESGCGKSLTAAALLGLAPAGARIEAGRVLLRGQDLLSAKPRQQRAMRGGAIGLVLQEAASALDPVVPVGQQLAEVLQLHRGLDRRRAQVEARRLLESVAVPDAGRRLHQRPHELSGGLRQRVLLAIALAGSPEVLIADEPTTALDVTVQAEILSVLRCTARDRAVGVLLITHDLGVVAEVCDRVLVMYCGEIVEEAPVEELFAAPAHPYSAALLEAAPRLGRPAPRGRLPVITGNVPPTGAEPEGCPFRPRCSSAWQRCGAEAPPLVRTAPIRAVRCFLHEQADEP